MERAHLAVSPMLAGHSPDRVGAEMSIHRHAARRDGNEPAIRERFARHGWHTEQLSMAGMPDLMCWAPEFFDWRIAILVDVKEPTGKPTPAQVKKWAELARAGIPVYVARTHEDVDAIVAGSADPWSETRTRPALSALKGTALTKEVVRRMKAGEPVYGDVPLKEGPAKRSNGTPTTGTAYRKDCGCLTRHDRCEHASLAAAALDRALAAAAEATFAPAPDRDCQRDDCGGCTECT